MHAVKVAAHATHVPQAGVRCLHTRVQQVTVQQGSNWYSAAYLA